VPSECVARKLRRVKLTTTAALLTPSYFPIVGGTETHVKDLTSVLRKHEIASEVITLCDTKKWQSASTLKRKIVDGSHVIVWPSCPIGKPSKLTQVHYIPFPLPQLRRYLKSFGLLHFHDDCDLSFPLAASRIKKPRIFTCHSLPYHIDFYAEHTLARRLFTTSADLFHVFSRNDEKGLKALGVPQDKLRVIPHGVDVALFNSKDAKLSRDTVRIVWFGRINRSKGVIVLLRALSILRNDFRNLELLIAGKGDAQYYRELIDYKTAAKLEEAKFVGFVDDLPSFLRQADIFVLPSLMETFGIVNLEAMASGLPVVASSVGGVPEVVADNETGFLVPPGDPAKLAEKLGNLVGDDQLRRKMGSKGRRRVEEFFSLDRVFELVLNMYRELV